jgi:hypothetical protein
LRSSAEKWLILGAILKISEMNERIDPNPREITFITQRASKSPFGEQ